MQRKLLIAIGSASLALLLGCQGKSFKIIVDRASSDAKFEGEPGAWTEAQYVSAKKGCTADFAKSEPKASSEQTEAYCGCLVTFARDKYAYQEYAADPEGLRDRQAKQGQVDECRAKASLPPLSATQRAWQPQMLFDNDPFFKSNPAVITLPGKKMVVTYGKAVNGRNMYYAVHFDGSKWTPPQVVGDTYDYFAVTKANNKGQIIALWAQAAQYPDGSIWPNGLVSATYDPAKGWQPVVLHRDRTTTGFIVSSSSFIDDEGNIAITWTVSSPNPQDPTVGQTNSYMRLFANGAWQEITSLGTVETVWPTVVITPDKMLHVLTGIGNTVGREVIMHAGRVPLATGRFTAADLKPLEQLEGANIISQQVEIGLDAKGNMTAIWSRGTQAAVPADWRTKITVAHYDTTKGMWELRPNFSSTGTGPTFYHRLRMAPNGTAFAVWVQNEGTRQLIWATRFDLLQGWSTPTPIDRNAAAESSAPALSINAKGEAIAVWAKRSLLDDKGWITMANHFNGFYWADETAISTKSAGNVTAFPGVSLNDEGEGFAFWTQGDGFDMPETDFMHMAQFK